MRLPDHSRGVRELRRTRPLTERFLHPIRFEDKTEILESRVYFDFLWLFFEGLFLGLGAFKSMCFNMASRCFDSESFVMSNIVMGKHKVIQKLPVSLSREIGKVAVKCAFLEHYISTILYDCLPVPHKEGRLAVIQPRLEDYPDLIKDVLSLKGIKCKTKTKKLSIRLRKIRVERNAIIHGLFMKEKGTKRILLRNLGGSWSIDHFGNSKKKKINPEGLHFTVLDCKSLESDMDVAIEIISRIEAEVKASLKKLPAPKPARQKNPGRSR